MLYLLEFDRSLGVLVSLRQYGPGQEPEAATARLELEIALNAQGVEREVVLLEARDEASLRATHARYFGELSAVAGQA